MQTTSKDRAVMTVWKEPTVEDTRRKLRQSMEMAFMIRNAILYSLSGLVCTVMATLASGYVRESWAWGLSSIMTGLFLVPLLGFCLWRIFKIFRKAEQYSFCRTTLAQPHSGIMRNTMNFSVLIELPDGTRLVRSTHSIFLTHGLMAPLMEDYINKTVTIGYNEETETVVVIG